MQTLPVEAILQWHPLWPKAMEAGFLIALYEDQANMFIPWELLLY